MCPSDLRWFSRTLPADGVAVESRADALCGFSISGPRARDLLAALTDEDVSNDAFRFLRSREMTIGPATARVMRISFTGELGYEMYLPEEHQVAVFGAIRAAGEPLGLVLIGGRALGSLRSEEHTSELQSRRTLVSRLLLEKKRSEENTSHIH